MSLHKSKASRKAALASPKNKTAAVLAGAAIAGAVAGMTAAPTILAAPPEHKRPAPDGFGPMRARRYDEATAIANAAAGLKSYTVVAPDREEDTLSYNLHGQRSVEYAPAYAVPTGGERRVFDKAEIGEETRRINAQAKTIAALSHSKNDVARSRKENERDAYQAHHQMGDFLDDEDGWNESIKFGKGKRK